MIRHIVLLKLKEETSAEAIEGISSALASMPEKIPQISNYVFGKDIAVSAGSADIGIMADFESIENYKAYSSPPAHVAAVQDVIKPHVAAKTAMQIEI